MSWKKVKLGDVLKQYRIEHWVQNETTYKQVTISKYDGVSYRGEKLGKEIGRKRQFLIDLEKFPDTLLFVRQGVQDGSIGIAPLEVNGCIVTENMPMFSVVGIEVDYLSFFLKSTLFKNRLSGLVPTGSAQKSIHEKQLLEIEIPLPSRNEQKRIVSFLNKFSCQFEAIHSETFKQQTYLQQLRQSILQEAVQGKLSELRLPGLKDDKMNGSNRILSSSNLKNHSSDNNDEDAATLLKRIKAEKLKLIKEGKLKKEKELPPITEDEIPFELPKGWVWCRWRDLLAFTQYPMKRGPFGSSLKKDMFVEKGIRVFEQYNPINNDPYWVRYYITRKKYEELKAFTAIAGDLLISCSGATLGRITELPGDAEFGIINQALLKLTLNSSVISNEYFIMLFRSSFIQSTILEEAGGSAIPNMVGVSVLKEILIPLPPFPEQQRIVAKVNKLQEQLSQLESQVQQSREYAEQLLQAVLKEAFEEKGTVYEMEDERVGMVAEE